MPNNVNKSLILKDLPKNITEIYIYGDGNNDIPLFRTRLNIPKKLHCIGQNIKLKNLSNILLNDYQSLFKYLTKYL